LSSHTISITWGAFNEKRERLFFSIVLSFNFDLNLNSLFFSVLYQICAQYRMNIICQNKINQMTFDYIEINPICDIRNSEPVTRFSQLLFRDFVIIFEILKSLNNNSVLFGFEISVCVCVWNPNI
jgi:hypothetical protein